MTGEISGRQFVTPEEFHKHIDVFACPKDFGFETEYMEKNCPPGYYQGDCKECWDSNVVVQKPATYAGRVVLTADDIYEKLEPESKNRFNRVIITDVSRDEEMNVVITFVAVNDIPKIDKSLIEGR